MRKQVVQAQEHGDYPFEELVERLCLPRDLGRHPLVDTLFVMQNMDHGGFQLPGIDVEPYKAEWHHAKYDLMVAGVEGEELSFIVEYRTDLFQTETICRMIRHFLHLLEQIISDPDPEDR